MTKQNRGPGRGLFGVSFSGMLANLRAALLLTTAVSTTALCLPACAGDEAEVAIGSQRAAIINGEACDASDLPATVALIVDAKIDFGGGSSPIRTLMCTGTLIAPDVALTAAHCVDPTALTGGFGTLTDATYYLSTQPDLSALVQMSNALPELPADAKLVRSVVKHEDFSLTGSEPGEGLGNFHDIGLVFLDEPITDIEPAIVITPEEAVDLAVGDEVRIAGWGQQTPEQSGPVGSKRCATTNIYELGDFEMQIGNEPDTARKCHGDSGGPTYTEIVTDTRRKQRVIGATSRAYDSSDCQRGGVDTMPSAWYEWIDARLSEKCDAGDRAWCEVSGVIDPGYYDEIGEDGEPLPGDKTDSGGCQVTPVSASGSGLLVLLACLGLALRSRSRRAARA